MGIILLGVYLILVGVLALFATHLPAWPMAVFAIVVGAVLLWKSRGQT